jgi:hypothetical protein
LNCGKNIRDKKCILHLRTRDVTQTDDIFQFGSHPVYARLQSLAGTTTIAQLPKAMPWGWTHAYLNDPDGHEVSLYSAGAKRLRGSGTAKKRRAAAK